MNEDERYTRVRVRRQLMPLLKELNPRAVEGLARTSKLLRDDSAALAEIARALLESASASEQEAGQTNSQEEVSGALCKGAQAEPGTVFPVPPLRVKALTAAPAALRRRALRMWLADGLGTLRRLEAVHISGVERLLEGQQGGRIAELPGGAQVVLRRGFLVLKDRKH
jgi:tRNA(Ile)-lysidine synthase